MKRLSSELKEKYGKGFDFSSLYKYVKFHQEFPQILDSLRPKSGRPLSWTHYRILLQETSPEARAWYAKEAQEQAWSVRTLQKVNWSRELSRIFKNFSWNWEKGMRL